MPDLGSLGEGWPVKPATVPAKRLSLNHQLSGGIKRAAAYLTETTGVIVLDGCKGSLWWGDELIHASDRRPWGCGSVTRHRTPYLEQRSNGALQ